MAPPLHWDPWLTVYAGDCRDVMRELPAESVNCVVTSPPYFGLRDYGITPTVWGGAEHEHEWGDALVKRRPAQTQGTTSQRAGRTKRDQPQGTFCDCGAWLGVLGLEPTPELYVEHLVEVFREVRRVLRRDGTLWLNLGDSYNNADKWGGGGVNTGKHTKSPDGSVPSWAAVRRKWAALPGIKPKDLVGIPWMAAFALRADGWYLRRDIIWSKPNAMPESVADRPTSSHEYVFLLTREPRYYFDRMAVAQPAIAGHSSGNGFRRPERISGGLAGGRDEEWLEQASRNIRSVWTVPTQPYSEAHFATFPEALVAPMILAGTSERGACPECGAPWRRVTESSERPPTGAAAGIAPENESHAIRGIDPTGAGGNSLARTETRTVGWEPSCVHGQEPVRAVVLDPFAGSGTVGLVAQRHSRRAILIDLNPEYLIQQMKRNAGVPLGL